MSLPQLIYYDTINQYRNHYERVYCCGKIVTFDNIRVYFKPEKFDHAFYESTNRDGCKDIFSEIRAQRIDWIKATLENPNADLFTGWNKKTRCHDDTRRVAVVYEDFVVIVAMRLKQDESLKANFVTCYQADNSIGKIRNAPKWSREGCLTLLTKGGE